MLFSSVSRPIGEYTFTRGPLMIYQLTRIPYITIARKKIRQCSRSTPV